MMRDLTTPNSVNFIIDILIVDRIGGDAYRPLANKFQRADDKSLLENAFRASCASVRPECPRARAVAAAKRNSPADPRCQPHRGLHFD